MTQTVLVADDSKTIRRIVEMALKASPYQVVGVDSAQAAMNAAAQGPSVIILDYYMPDGSGYDVCRALKSEPSTSRIPVLMLGGTYKNFDEAMARQSGADGVLMKPFKTDALLDSIEQVANGTAAPPPVHNPPPVQTPDPIPATTTPDLPTPNFAAQNTFEPEPHTQPVEPEQIMQPPPVDPAERTPMPTPEAVGTRTSGSGLSAVGLSRTEIEALVREEVKAAVRAELPALLRTVMGDIFQQKVLPKLLERADQRVAAAVESGVNQKIQEQVRTELERLLSED